MASSVNQYSVNQFPPVASLPSVLLSKQSSTLAASLFTSDTGYPNGLALGAALDQNSSGRFNLVSGLTVASNAASVAQNHAQDIQRQFNELQLNIAAITNNDNLTESERDYRHAKIQENLDAIQNSINQANIGGFNLLSAADSRGAKLDVNSGAFANTGVTPSQNINGNDRTFAYQPGEVGFQTTDLQAALDDLRSVNAQSYPNVSDAQNSNGTSYTLSRFQNTLNQATTALNNFQQQLTQTASEFVGTSDTTQDGGIANAVEARQIASRLAEQLSQDSFNITANPAAKYFSLFA